MTKAKSVGTALISSLFLVFSTKIVLASEGAVNATDLGHYLGAQLGVSDWAGGLAASALLIALFVIPTAFASRRNPVIPCLITGFMAMGLSIALGWLDYWWILVIGLLVALLFAGKARDWITGTVST